MPISGVPLIEFVCWDKDRFGKDYMGEFDLALEDIFPDGKVKTEVASKVLCTCENTLIDLAGLVYSEIEEERQQEIQRFRRGAASIFHRGSVQYLCRTSGDLSSI